MAGPFWRELPDRGSQLVDAIPIRCVTILEVYVRETVRELIDRGPPFIDRAERLSKSVRLDFEFVRNLQGQKVSVGDLIAHSISVSNVGSIMGVLEELMPGFATKIVK